MRDAIIKEIETLLRGYGVTLADLNSARDATGPLTDADRLLLQALLSHPGLVPRPPWSVPRGMAGTLRFLVDNQMVLADETTDRVHVARRAADALHYRLRIDGQAALVRRAHRSAADYWRWRVDVWPQGAASDVHDLEESRYHSLAAGDDEAVEDITERLRARLNRLGPGTTRPRSSATRSTASRYDRRGAGGGCDGSAAWRRTEGISPTRSSATWRHSTSRGNSPTGPASRPAMHAWVASMRKRGISRSRRTSSSLPYGPTRSSGIASRPRAPPSRSVRSPSRSAALESPRRHTSWPSPSTSGCLDRAGMARSLDGLGRTALSRGDYEGARRVHGRALQLFEQLDDPTGAATTLSQLGLAARATGDYIGAENLYRRALGTFAGRAPARHGQQLPAAGGAGRGARRAARGR